MLKVLKSGSVNVTAVPKTVSIPDAVIIRDEREDSSVTLESLGIDLSVYSPEHIRILENYFQERKKNLTDSVNKEVLKIEEEASKKLENSNKQALQITSEAEEQAKKILQNANIQAEQILEDVKQRENEIYQEAESRGLVEGQRKKADEISNCFARLDSQLKYMNQVMSQRFDEITPKLKYLALEIAEKVVCKKIEEDDKYLYELVLRAMKELKEPEWLTVEISDKMAGLISYLEEQQKIGVIAENVEFNSASSDVGDITIESQAGLCDASITTQLKNIRNYFDNDGDEDGLHSGNGQD